MSKFLDSVLAELKSNSKIKFKKIRIFKEDITIIKITNKSHKLKKTKDILVNILDKNIKNIDDEVI